MVGFSIQHSNQGYESSNNHLYDKGVELFGGIRTHYFFYTKQYIAQYHLLRD
ncbi:hypothetical protein N482_15780 [Pseudoalteromonas luteoviolacea NCIMB 1942]|uniref:Uncharacterized protein n=1 Tax=Pseudoalteromonas luteoviolacea NCIMB 1942 TaxID=1365253 RepID=A0A166ZWS2_9GAMM|nr:hypothetical protein N482_15780 [Pseudoalteromonas luteoviolacea NCIMB 1942]